MAELADGVTVIDRFIGEAREQARESANDLSSDAGEAEQIYRELVCRRHGLDPFEEVRQIARGLDRAV